MQTEDVFIGADANWEHTSLVSGQFWHLITFYLVSSLTAWCMDETDLLESIHHAYHSNTALLWCGPYVWAQSAVSCKDGCIHNVGMQIALLRLMTDSGLACTLYTHLINYWSFNFVKSVPCQDEEPMQGTSITSSVTNRKSKRISREWNPRTILRQGQIQTSSCDEDEICLVGKINDSKCYSFIVRWCLGLWW